MIESKVNKGSSGARNIALREAKGQYIAFLDSDDMWHSHFLEKQLLFIKERDASLVFSSYRRIDEDTKEELLSPFLVPEKVNYKSLLKTCPIFPSTAVYDTKKIRKSYFNEELGSMRDDYVYWLSMFKTIDYGYGNPEILVDYRMRKSSVTGNKTKVIKPQWNVLYKVEKLGLEAGSEVTFDQVLLVGDKDVKVGTPTVDGASVKATVVAEGKSKKVIVYRYKRKTGYHKKNGHRQPFTQVKIEKING